ncbi:BTAD domain-containing putative transcriptional regulator [Kribbella sp. NPDC051620]|uniref:BTAD domain-containing putative transcriptional regulator n=1 Tax=Kribbella sp. NPDC051620 TaxID=3364120 RepID=UPI003794E949
MNGHSAHTPARIAFRVLGPLEVDGPDGAPIDVCGGKPATMLTLLLLHRNAWVSTDQLIDAVWSVGEPPASAQRNLKTYVWQLRRALPGERIESRPGAYRVTVLPGELDADVAAGLSDEARRLLTDGSAEEAAVVVEHALGLWRGCPYDGLTGDASTAVDRLTELHRSLREDLADAHLALGRPADAIALLRALTDEEPLREHAWTKLMTTLHQTGRRHDALSAYQRARTTLVRELGIEPGAELVTLHQQILNEEPPAPATTELRTPTTPQSDLPPRISHFTGRQAELAALRAAVAGVDGGGPPAAVGGVGGGERCAPDASGSAAADRSLARDSRALPGGAAESTARRAPAPRAVAGAGAAPASAASGSAVASRTAGPALSGRRPEVGGVAVVTVDGMAGVGKTAFVLEAAGVLADGGPERQMYLDLRAHGNEPVGTAEALGRLLRRVGFKEQLPEATDELGALWREVAPRVLLVLDDVVDVAQVRALMPNTAGSVVLVTSRSRLVGLERAVAVSIRPFESTVLVADEEILRVCGGHPGALRELSDRVRDRQPWTAARLLARLSDRTGRARELANTLARFDSTYDELEEPVRRFYRLLSMTPQFDVRRAARLLDADQQEVEPMLDELLDRHLVDEPAPGRFALHPLVRDHAYAMLLSTESEAELTAAADRVRLTGQAKLELVAPKNPRVA